MKGIFFDLDGTLIDSDRAVFSALIQGMDLLQIPYRKDISPEEAMSFSGKSLPEIVNAFVDKPFRTKETLEIIYRTIPEIYNHDFFLKEITVYEGIPDLLSRLSGQGFHLAVISNSTQQVVEEICSCFFDGIFAFRYGDRGENRVKPDPVGIISALSAFSLSADDAVYIGDTMTDVQTAQAAGVQMIGALWNRSPNNEILRRSNCCPVAQRPQDIIPQISLTLHI